MNDFYMQLLSAGVVVAIVEGFFRFFLLIETISYCSINKKANII